MAIKKKSSSKSVVKSKLAVKSKRAVKKRAKFSPAWVVRNAKDAPGYKLNIISKLRVGVLKSEWKSLLADIDATEKEFEHVLPTSISSLQKKNKYGRETSERIYELANLFGLGFQVFDSETDFKNWLITPSKALGNKMPFALLDSSFGFELVENEIIRIKYNVYS